MNNNVQLEFGTKAETLAKLSEAGFQVPPVFFFPADRWSISYEEILKELDEYFDENIIFLAVRSSALVEDSAESSMAGAFESYLDIPRHDKQVLVNSINKVIDSFKEYGNGQILVQPMVQNVQMSGVVLTKVLDDGSPYYVINYDDVSGKTDSITAGRGNAKVVFIYNGVEDNYFDSERLKSVLTLVKKLETVFPGAHLDIEFAIDDNCLVHLLQVRRICATKNWKPHVVPEISKRIRYVESFVNSYIEERPGLFGGKTIFAVMPDWNPAEMIGTTPRPLALSLYRTLITKDIWRRARAEMGYRSLPSVELMVSIVGRPYIDVRASFNSFLPDGLGNETGNILVNAWIDRLDKYPQFHDKVEFNIVPTVMDFDFDETMSDRYPNLLSSRRKQVYADKLRHITNKALQKKSTLHRALTAVNLLKNPNKLLLENKMFGDNPLLLMSRISKLLAECQEYGTLPFSVAARHGFIAESLLRSGIRKGALSEERVSEFKRSIKTVSSKMTADFREVFKGGLSKEKFLEMYGHLRPGTYDIITPRYADRSDLFDQWTELPLSENINEFKLKSDEELRLSALLKEAGLHSTPGDLLNHARIAITAREYIKFIFSRHISALLELLAMWGKLFGFSREMVAMLPIDLVTGALFSPLPDSDYNYFSEHISEGQKMYDLTKSLKLSHIIRSKRDVYVVPQLRSSPNFITDKRIEADVFYLQTGWGPENSKSLSGAIVCIEGADPGYDWIFSRNIAGLITKYGGSNSHMAIRCAEYSLPAAIGCGELLFQRVIGSRRCMLDCAGNTITTLGEVEL